MTDPKVVAMPEPAAKGAFCQTPTASAILEVIKYGHEGNIVLIVGSPGVGKTTALKHYAESHQRAFYCPLSQAYSALVPALTRVCDSLGTVALRTGACEVRSAIVRRLDVFCDKCVILIDEAQHASDQALEEIRSIHDETGVGVVLAGNATFPTRFNGKRGEAVFAQLTSRIGMDLPIKAPLPEDVAALCGHHFVRGRRAQKFLADLAARKRGLREVSKLIDQARKDAGAGRPVEFHHLNAAACLLWGERNDA